MHRAGPDTNAKDIKAKRAKLFPRCRLRLEAGAGTAIAACLRLLRVRLGRQRRGLLFQMPQAILLLLETLAGFQVLDRRQVLGSHASRPATIRGVGNQNRAG
jgi:hypothetical protein